MHPRTEKEKKDKFFRQINDTIKDVNKRDILILTGDLNAKVGKEN